MSTGEEEEDETKKTQQQKVKRRASMFSKLGSYRQKKNTREAGKITRNNHLFVLVSCSNSTTCDICGKSMANKPALQCENCNLNVHENSCKEQTFNCTRNNPRYGKQKSYNGDSYKEKSSSLPGGPGLSQQPKSVTVSTQEKEKRALSVPPRAQNVTNLNTNPLGDQSSTIPKNISPSSAARNSVTNIGYFQWRRVANKLGIDRVISEDRTKERQCTMDETINHGSPSRPTDNSLILEALSASTESLDDSTEVPPSLLLEDEPDLALTEQEPEAWSVTVDKKILKKMTAKNIKRQDHIWEFIQTEKSYYRTLKIMHKIFSQGMLQDLHMTQDVVDRIFPKLEDLMDIHVTFLRSLVTAQKLSHDKSVEDIGAILIKHFEGRTAERMMEAYGEFCSKHNDSLQLYKDLLKTDVAFQSFIKKSSRNYLCKRLGIPECILLVTQRMTKYPILIESIIKTTSDTSTDRALLMQCLSSTREILSHIDRQVDAHAKEQKLFDIYNRIDARSSATLNGKKFKKSDLLSNKRKLLHEGHMKWISARGKPLEILSVLLSDVLFFLADNNQKYTFCSQDNKSSAIPLSKLLVREKGDTRDSKGLYLIVQRKTEPEMYEFVCKSSDDRKIWIKTVREAIASCPEDAGELSETEEDKKLLEAVGSRIRQLIDHLHQKDNAISLLCEDKMNVILEILETFAKEDIFTSYFISTTSLNKTYCSDLKSFNPNYALERRTHSIAESECSKTNKPAEVFQILLNEVTGLFSLMQPTSRTICLMRSFSSGAPQGSVGSNSMSTLEENTERIPLPKRAETFGGFDSKLARTNSLDVQHSIVTNYMEELKAKLNDSSTPRASCDVMIEESSSGIPISNPTDNATIVPETSQLIPSESQLDETSSITPSQVVRSISSVAGDNEEIEDDDADSSMKKSLQLALTKEHYIHIARIVQCVHKIMCLTARRDTEIESLKAHLTEANGKVCRLQAESDRFGHDRKSSLYHPDKQLEELRSLQSSIQQQKLDLEKLREREAANANSKQDELSALEEAIRKERMEMKAEKEELQRQREALQCQIDYFEEQKQRCLKSSSSLGQIAIDEVGRSRSGTPPYSGMPPKPEGAHKSLKEAACHQRSSSDDLLQKWTAGEAAGSRRLTPGGGLPTGQAAARNVSFLSSSRHDGRPISRIHSMSAVVDVGAGGTAALRRTDQLPMQLLSAANEQRAGQISQQIPLKLASNSFSGSKTGDENPRGIQYSSSAGNRDAKFWHRLTSGSRSALDSLVDSAKSSSSLPATPQVNSPTTSPPNSYHTRQDGISGMSNRVSQSFQTTRNSQDFPTTSQLLFNSQSNLNNYSNMKGSEGQQVGQYPYNRATSSSSILPNRISQVYEYQASNRIPQNSDNQTNRQRLVSALSSGNLLPMKLAERQRPKSASSASNNSTGNNQNIGQQTNFPSSIMMQQQQQLQQHQQQQQQQNITNSNTSYDPHKQTCSTSNMANPGHSRSSSNVEVHDVVYL